MARLVDNMAYHTRSWVQVLREEFGLNIDPKDWERRTAGKTTPVIMREEVDPRMSDARIEEINERKEEQYRQMFRPNLALADGAGDFTPRQKHGHSAGRVHMANKINLDFVLDGCGIRDVFDAALCREDITHGKPDPKFFSRARRRWALRPTAAWCLKTRPLASRPRGGPE